MFSLLKCLHQEIQLGNWHPASGRDLLCSAVNTQTAPSSEGDDLVHREHSTLFNTTALAEQPEQTTSHTVSQVLHTAQVTPPH